MTTTTKVKHVDKWTNRHSQTLTQIDRQTDRQRDGRMLHQKEVGFDIGEQSLLLDYKLHVYTCAPPRGLLWQLFKIIEQACDSFGYSVCNGLVLCGPPQVLDPITPMTFCQYHLLCAVSLLSYSFQQIFTWEQPKETSIIRRERLARFYRRK